jgi:tetratricopeptide (TPR) repeat protein
MAIEGKLQDIGLADICQLLAMGRKTGCLSVTDRSDFGYVFFEGGLIVHATVLNRRDGLAEMLLANELVTHADLERARTAAAMDGGVHYGRLLVREQKLDEAQLERLAHIQVEEAVYRLFEWNEGSFHFATDDAPPEGVAALVTIPAESLLLEGARRVDEWTRIRESIPSAETVVRLLSDPREAQESPIEVGPREVRILDRLDGARPVRVIVRESGVVEFEVARFLHQLIQEGFAEAAGEEGTPGDPDMPETARDRAESRLELGRAFYRAGMWDDAERELRGAIDEDPASVEALERLAAIRLRVGDPASAIKLLERAAALGTTSDGHLRNLALAFELEGRFDEALEVLERAEESGADAGLHLARGILLLKLDRAVEAHAAFGEVRGALAEGEEPPPAFHSFGMIAALLAGEDDEALRIGREGLELHPWSGPVLVNLGAVLEARGEHAAAEALYLRATGEERTPAQAHRSLGDLARRRGDTAGARAHYERALRLDPDLGDATCERLGIILEEEGDPDQARRLWRRALELNPRNQTARDRLGRLASGVRG